jgi:hypothetical protein
MMLNLFRVDTDMGITTSAQFSTPDGAYIEQIRLGRKFVPVETALPFFVID